MARRLERIDRPIKVLTKDIYALSSLRTMLYVATPQLLPMLFVLLIPVLAPGDYFQRVATLAAIYGLLALSWDFIALSTGLVNVDPLITHRYALEDLLDGLQKVKGREDEPLKDLVIP